MKVNEAPEKIYICNNVFPSHVDWDGSPINTKKIDNNDIEYIRIDAFIEKACEWLIDNCPTNDGYELYVFIRDFQKAMEVGEE